MKPMLAVDVADFTKIRYPVYGSPKIDGVRGLMLDAFRPRSLKVFPNLATREHFNKYQVELSKFDGELRVGQMNAPDMCRATSSALAKFDGDPQAVWHIFDYVDETKTFEQRVSILRKKFGSFSQRSTEKMRVELVHQELIRSAAEAEAFEHEQLSRGYEGVVFKSLGGRYKFGRSTIVDQSFMRTKRFVDAEAEIIGFEELLRNNNQAKINELGDQVRSHHKANKVGGGLLGAFQLRVLTGPLKGAEFDLGTGFSEDQRVKFWLAQDRLIGKTVKFKYFAHGVKDKPRWPSFQGFRESFDM